jgi:hypothetical protein
MWGLVWGAAMEEATELESADVLVLATGPASKKEER